MQSPRKEKQTAGDGTQTLRLFQSPSLLFAGREGHNFFAFDFFFALRARFFSQLEKKFLSWK